MGGGLGPSGAIVIGVRVVNVELELEFVVVATAVVTVKLPAVLVDSGINEESGCSIRTA